MTVTNTERSERQLGNNVLTVFTFDIVVFASQLGTSDIEVRIIDRATDVITSTLVYNGGGADGWSAAIDESLEQITVTVNTAPTASEDIQIFRTTEAVQDSDFPFAGSLPSKSIEDALDRVTLGIQEVKEEVSRSAKLPDTITATLELPPYEANSVLAWDAVTQNLLVNQAGVPAVIGDASITEPKYATDSVSNRALDDDAVQTSNIVDDNVTTAKIADVNVTTAKIADGAITASKHASDTLNQMLVASHRENNGVDGGTFTQDAWQTRELVEDYNTITGASVAVNQVTLPAATYEVSGYAVGWRVETHKCRLRDTTGGSTLLIGSAAYSDISTDGSGDTSSILGVITLSVESDLELQHICDTTKSTNGFGLASVATDPDSEEELYASISFRKLL